MGQIGTRATPSPMGMVVTIPPGLLLSLSPISHKVCTAQLLPHSATPACSAPRFLGRRSWTVQAPFAPGKSFLACSLETAGLEHWSFFSMPSVPDSSIPDRLCQSNIPTQPLLKGPQGTEVPLLSKRKPAQAKSGEESVSFSASFPNGVRTAHESPAEMKGKRDSPVNCDPSCKNQH